MLSNAMKSSLKAFLYFIAHSDFIQFNRNDKIIWSFNGDDILEMNFNIDVTRLHASKSSSIGTIECFPKLFTDPQTRFGKWDKMYFLYESIPSCQCSAILFPLVIVGIKKKMNLLTPALILGIIQLFICLHDLSDSQD